MKKIVLDCKKCGGALDILQDMEMCQCPYCGMSHIIEREGDNVKLIERVSALEKKVEEITGEPISRKPLEIFEAYTGKVTNVTYLYALLDLPQNNIGWLHVSKYNKERDIDLHKELKIGDEVKVVVESFKEDAWGYRVNRIPVLDGKSPLKINTIYRGKVISVRKYQAVVELPFNNLGSLHRSRVDIGGTSDITKVLKVGDEIDVSIEEFRGGFEDYSVTRLPILEGKNTSDK